MPLFTIESTYQLPVFRQRTYDAETIDKACRLAIEDNEWSGAKVDAESSGENYVTGVWMGADAAYKGPAAPIPSQFRETIQRKADHFETLLGILKVLAHAPDVTAPDAAFWRPRAEAAIAKAEAILAGAPDSARPTRPASSLVPRTSPAVALGLGVHILLHLTEEDVRAALPEIIGADTALTTITTEDVTDADIRAACLAVVERTDLSEERGLAVFNAAIGAIHQVEERRGPSA